MAKLTGRLRKRPDMVSRGKTAWRAEIRGIYAAVADITEHFEAARVAIDRGDDDAARAAMIRVLDPLTEIMLRATELDRINEANE